jgi:hypothetical protein
MKRNVSCRIEQSRPSLQRLLLGSHAFRLTHPREAVALVVPAPVASMPVASMPVAFVPVASVPVASVQEPIGVEPIEEPMSAEALVPPPSVPLLTARLRQLPTTAPNADMRRIHLAIEMLRG